MYFLADTNFVGVPNPYCFDEGVSRLGSTIRVNPPYDEFADGS